MLSFRNVIVVVIPCVCYLHLPNLSSIHLIPIQWNPVKPNSQGNTQWSQLRDECFIKHIWKNEAGSAPQNWAALLNKMVARTYLYIFL